MKTLRSAEETRQLFETHLLRETGSWKDKHSLYQPMAYILQLKAKRVRPVMALLTWQALSAEEPIPALDLAFAIETFHNFTLVHDDIMDNADVRRGQPTVHVKWNTNTAILGGDALFAISMHYLTRGFPRHAARLSEEYSRLAFGVCEGQLEDMELAGRAEVSVAEYLEMIRKKTAMLLGGSMSLAAIAAGAEENLRQDCYWLGEAAGIAFQLQDDYLDAFGDAQAFGKKIGGDILENKNTFLLIRAKEKAKGGDAEQLRRLLHEEKDAESKIGGVLALYEKLGIREETHERVRAAFSGVDDLRERLNYLPGFSMLDQYLSELPDRKW